MSGSTRQAEAMSFAGADTRRLRFLGEAGALALCLGDVDRAARIFRGLEILCPQEPAPYHGLAEVALIRGDLEAARNASRRSQTVERTTALSQALGLVLEARSQLLAGDLDGSRSLLEQARNLNPDGPGGELASALLEEFARETLS